MSCWGAQVTVFGKPSAYDYYVRGVAETDRIIAYILNNPVKAEPVEYWAQWPNTYLKPNW